MTKQTFRRQTTLNKARRATFILGVMILVTVILSVNVNAVLTDSLISYYKLDEASGDVIDIYGSNDGTNDGATRGVIGKVGNAFSFDGDNDFVSVSDNDSLSFPSALTFSLWLYPTDNDSTILISKGAGAGTREYHIRRFNETAMEMGLGDAAGAWDIISRFDISTPLNEWSHGVFTWNGTLVSIYKNSTLIHTFSKSGAIINAGEEFNLATLAGSDFYGGRIDEVGIWNRSLNASEITSLWANGDGLGYPFTDEVSVTLISPTNNTNITTTKQFNATITPETYNLTNATFYMWYSSNGSVFNTIVNNSLSGDSALTVSFDILNIPVDTVMLWNVYGCQGNGAGTNCSFAPSNFTVNTKKIYEENQVYNSKGAEGTSQTFRINISVSPAYALSQGNFIFNGTSYAGSFSAVDTMMYQFTRTITLTSVAANTNISFYWDITLTDATEFNSSTNNQTILNLGIDNCSSYSIEIFNFTLVDEETQATLNGTSDNTSIKIDIDLYSSSTSTSPVIEFHSSYNETNPVGVCISDELNESYYYLDAQIEYSAGGYVHKFYHIQNYILNGTSNPSQNITLYDLSDDDAQAFKISYKDESFLAVEGALIQIQRKYIEEGVFKTVEILKTDSNGEAIGQLVLNDIIYSLTIVKEGEILAVFDNVYAICQNPIITECEINLNSFSSTIDATDFYISEDFAFTLDYDRTIRTITATFSIPSGVVSTVVLNVTKEDALGTEVCSESVTTSAGTLTCVVGSSFGNGTVMTKLYSNGILKGQGQINLAQSPLDIYGGSLIFLGLFIMLTLIGVGLSDNPVLTAIFLVVGVILLFALNLVSHHGFIGATATILWLIIAVILIVIKGSRRT